MAAPRGVSPAVRHALLFCARGLDGHSQRPRVFVWNYFLQQVFNGIMFGSTYAIVALGLTLVMGILHIPNFAHGHLYMLGGYITYFFITALGLGYWPSLLLSMLVLGLLGVILEAHGLPPPADQPHINAFIAAIGALLVLESFGAGGLGSAGIAHSQPVSPNLPVPGHHHEHPAAAGDFRSGRSHHAPAPYSLKRPLTGTTIEAVAQNREGAMLNGINVNRVSA
jgi:branched-chain amino acid transport system permease protein